VHPRALVSNAFQAQPSFAGYVARGSLPMAPQEFRMGHINVYVFTARLQWQFRKRQNFLVASRGETERGRAGKGASQSRCVRMAFLNATASSCSSGRTGTQAWLTDFGQVQRKPRIA